MLEDHSFSPHSLLTIHIMKTLLVLLILFFSLEGRTQNRCEYILLQQFFYHLKAENPDNIKEYSCNTYVPANLLESKTKDASSCIFDANQHVLKHNTICSFNRYGELEKLVCTDTEGNIWEERAYYSDNKCNCIYISKNGSLESMYKVCFNKDDRPMISRQMVRTDEPNALPGLNPRIFGTGITYSLHDETSRNSIIVTPDNFFYSQDGAYHLYTFNVTPPENVKMKYNEQGDWTALIWHDNSKKVEYITEREIAYFESK